MKTNLYLVKQGESVVLSREEADFLKRHLSSKSIGKFSVEGKKLSLRESDVGVLKTPERTIVVEPEDSQFSFTEVLRLYIYTEFGEIRTDALGPEYGLEPHNFIPNLTKRYLSELNKIKKRGLVGRYKENLEISNFSTGKPIFEKSKMNSSRTLSVANKVSRNKVDNEINRIVKYCTEYLVDVVESKELSQKLKNYLRLFRRVTTPREVSETQLDRIFLYSNESHYTGIVKLSNIILKNLFYKRLGDDLIGYQFLLDYNALFEKFVRTVLRDTDPSFTYWGDGQSREYAEYYDPLSGTKNTKEYLPDLLYNYDELENTAQAVLDAKNKTGKVFDNPDVYQIKFYMDLLNASKGMLIYPSANLSKEIKMTIRSEKETLNIYAVLVNLKGDNEEFGRNLKATVNGVKKIL